MNLAFEIYKYHLGENVTIPYYPIIKHASCYVPFLDRFYVTCSNRYDYPGYTMTNKEWRKSIIKPVTLYGLTISDFNAYIAAYCIAFKTSISVLIRAKNHIPENMSIKTYLKGKFNKRQ